MSTQSKASAKNIFIILSCLGIAYGLIGYSGLAGCKTYSRAVPDLNLFTPSTTWGGATWTVLSTNIVVMPYAGWAFWIAALILATFALVDLVRRRPKPGLLLAGILAAALLLAHLQANRLPGLFIPCSDTIGREVKPGF